MQALVNKINQKWGEGGGGRGGFPSMKNRMKLWSRTQQYEYK